MRTRRGPKPETIARAKALGLTTDEVKLLRSRIATALVNLEACRIYWLQSHRCIVARSVQVTRAFRIPAGALLVGEYEHGIATAEVLGDLAEVIQRTRTASRIAPPAREAGAGR